MNYLGWILFSFGLLRLVISFVNWCCKMYLSDSVLPSPRPILSVLIPARNEEDNIQLLLKDLVTFRYRPLEIIVYNDQSTDNTAGVVRTFTMLHSHIRLINGDGPDKGWLGKNYACDQLARHAGGEKLLFLDADVRVKDGLAEKSIAYMERYNLSLLSVFPLQILSGPGPRLAVPLMNWILLSLLPLPLIRLSGQKSLSAANGQFMLFDAAAYQRYRPHARFRNDPVEDIAILEFFKIKNIKVATLLGTEEIRCNMYNTLNEAVKGFTKNIFRFFGGRKFLAFLFATVTTLTPIWLFIFNGLWPGLIYLVMILGIQFFTSKASRQPVMQNIIGLVPRQAVFWYILITAYKKQKEKNIKWKDRNISVAS